MKISLCAIVKNDGFLIGKMLKSVVGVVDEIILADTGSTDNTLEIVEKFQNENPDLLQLFHFEWVDDFSAARNFTLSKASGDWILVLDADEFLDAEEKLHLRTFLENTNGHGVFVKQRNYTGSMRDIVNVLDVDVCRVFRKGYEYEGTIHEQIATAIVNENAPFENFTLHLHHIGYTEEYLKLKNKNSRNVALLEEQMRNIPYKEKVLRWFTASNLLAEYSGMQQWEKVIHTARPVIEEMKKMKKERPNFLSRVYKFCINGYRFSERYNEAIRFAKEALNFYPKNTDLRMMLAETYLLMGDFGKAIEELKKCREMGDIQFNFVEYVEGNGTYVAARQIGYAWMRLGDDLTAREWFVKSYEENTEQKGLIPLIVMTVSEVMVLKTMEKVIQTPQRYDEFIESMAIVGHPEVIMFIEKAEKKFGVRPATKRARFAYEVRQGMEPSLPENPSDVDLARMGLWHYEQGDKDKANEMWFSCGGLGEYFFRITTQCSRNIKWEIQRVIDEIMAACAVNFLTDYGLYISDLAKFFPYILRTDVLAGFTSDEYLQASAETYEDCEWKAQVCLAKGELEWAEKWMKIAYLKNGNRTVRGFMIDASMHPDKSESIMREARKVYPDSKMLSLIWKEQFAPKLEKGVLRY
ncbi:glycosyltransferase [Alicyclobacillus fodiniaquatilis]|uniref:Glycosyltransferase n=1 Tax=Alicyclobacillus fodiniaquatilis TaxID=1661150 RepID=A0ABW4JQH0_9BACL